MMRGEPANQTKNRSGQGICETDNDLENMNIEK